MVEPLKKVVLLIMCSEKMLAGQILLCARFVRVSIGK